ncbi:MAG: zinc-binding dehydrogenase [Pseudomonadota bacterium]
MSLPISMKAIVFQKGENDPANPAAHLLVTEKPVPAPQKGEVLVKMEASSCNPSDLLSMRGVYSVNAVQDQIMGFEGCGRVIASNAGPLGMFLKGKRVSCAKQDGDGLWAEYACLPATNCIPVGDSFPAESAAAFVVNPMTSYAMMEEARKAGRKAVIQAAAASQVGRGIIGLGKSMGIEVISVVRRDAQMQGLNEIGATHVLNQNAETFGSDLAALCEKMRPETFFDPVGGLLTAKIQSNLPENAEVVVYGYLDESEAYGGRFSPRELIFKNHTIRNFWLKPYFEKLGLIGGLKASNAVIRLFKDGVFRTEVASWSDIEDYPNAINAYVANMTQGKALLKIS